MAAFPNGKLVVYKLIFPQNMLQVICVNTALSEALKQRCGSRYILRQDRYVSEDPLDYDCSKLFLEPHF